MEEESDLNPPASKYRKTDEESVAYKPPSSNHQKSSSSKCLVYVLLIVVLQSIAFLVVGLVVLRVKSPNLQLSNVIVQDLLYESASLNMTMVAEIRIHNTNFGRFKFHGGSTTLLYENATIGATVIYVDGGGVGSREKRNINATVRVMAGSGHGFSANYMNLSRDIGLGMVRLRSFAELKGEVRVVKIVNRRRTAFMNCTMDLNLTSQAIQGLLCQ